MRTPLKFVVLAALSLALPQSASAQCGPDPSQPQLQGEVIYDVSGGDLITVIAQPFAENSLVGTWLAVKTIVEEPPQTFQIIANTHFEQWNISVFTVAENLEVTGGSNWWMYSEQDTFDIFAALGGPAVAYCTAGTSASGCNATLSSTGTASASAPSGFLLCAEEVEGGKDGLYFLGTNGRQANPWGSGSSFQCVVPPVGRAGLLTGNGTTGSCDGFFDQDLNAYWAANPSKNPGAGALVQAQLWYRDPQSPSNQTTSLSDALEFSVCP
jgi:hypothetical protein